jgi:hypothetical protein
MTRRTLLHIKSDKHPVANKSVSIVQGATMLKLVPAGFPPLNADGETVSLKVETNAEDWTVTTADNWLTASKNADVITLTAAPNDGFTERSSSFTVASQKYMQKQTVEITQLVNFVPYVKLGLSVATFDRNGSSVDVAIETNIADLTVETVPLWITIAQTSTGVKLSSGKCYAPKRNATLKFVSATYPEVTAELPLTQTGSYTFKENIFTDDFNWVGNASETANKGDNSENLTTDSPQSEITYWANDFGTDNGWTSTPTLNGSNNRPWIYSRYHHVKFGRSGNSADMISPKVTVSGTDTKTVLVTFRCVAHSATETNRDFMITVTGGGKIVDVLKTGLDNTGKECLGEVTRQGAHFVIGNYWIALSSGGAVSNWGDDYALRSFVVEGFSSDTQIHFIGDETYQPRAITGTRRYGFDDVTFDVIE